MFAGEQIAIYLASLIFKEMKRKLLSDGWFSPCLRFPSFTLTFKQRLREKIKANLTAFAGVAVWNIARDHRLNTVICVFLFLEAINASYTKPLRDFNWQVLQF